MSIIVTTDIQCDGAGCLRWTDGVASTRIQIRLAREEARKVGWRHYDGKDLCPACVKKDQEAKGAKL